MLQKFSFAGVSAAAIALAVLCPSPARALNFNWTFTSGSGEVVSGTINDLIEGSNTQNTSPLPYVVVTSATGSLGTSGIIGRNLTLYDPNSEIFVSGGVPFSNGTSSFVRFHGNDMAFLTLYDTYFRNGANGLFDMQAKSISMTVVSIPASSSPQSFTAVPAPLPLLGLGAATAFSRQLKQRIAVKRTRGEVGAAV